MHKLSGALLITEVSCAEKGIPRDAATNGEKKKKKHNPVERTFSAAQQIS